MNVLIFHESGEQAALYGLGLSFGVTSNIDPVDFMYTTLHEGVANRLLMRARRLSGLGNGHDKFLRMLRVDLLITAPLYWWKQFDTYKVGTVTQSESTMHTLMKSPITQNMFESGLHPDILNILENMRLAGNFDGLNNLLPHSFLQTRMVSTNYAVLQNITSCGSGASSSPPSSASAITRTFSGPTVWLMRKTRTGRKMKAKTTPCPTISINPSKKVWLH